MNRVQFTIAISEVVVELANDPDMVAAGYDVAFDFCKRTDHEQQYLFSLNTPTRWVTNCDGVRKVSEHQHGKAMDLLLFKDGKLVDIWPEWVIERVHKKWDERGGVPLNPHEPGHLGGGL